MTRRMDLDRMSTVIDEAVSVSVGGIQFPGIVDAEPRSVDLSPERLQEAATQLKQHGHVVMSLPVEVELFLRISNNDVLSSIECTDFLVELSALENGIQAVASTDNKWEIAWERGIKPIKETVLESMRRDILSMDHTLLEDSHTFRAGMVLLASEVVGPHSDRIATLLSYPAALVQVMAARLQEAKIWEGDEVRCESWFDPKNGAMAFMLDWTVAEGKLTRKWSEEKEQYVYHNSDVRAVSQFAV
jgi:hypothetical protein